MNTLRLACASALVFLACSGGAYALDADAAAKAFLTPAKSAGSETSVTMGAVSEEGSDVVVKDVMTSAKVDGEETAQGVVAEVRFKNVAETGDGQFTASGAEYSDITFSVQDKMEIKIPKIIIDDLRTRNADSDKIPMPVVYKSVVGDNLTLLVKEQNVMVNVDQVRFAMDDFANDVPSSGNMSITGIDIPLAAFPPGPNSPQALGYTENLVFDINAKGRARYDTAGFSLDDMTISADTIGSLSLGLDMDNYPNLMNTENPNPMEMMNVVLNSIRLKYVDDSLAVRILDMMAKQQGIERAQFAQQISMALPFMLSAINNQEFQNEVATAAGAFLTDPGTIEVNVMPEKPMSAAEIMGVAQSAPHTLPDQLNVTIEAR
ncbi:MAG TPA: hypothetical protein VKN63_07870 [Afifellaceae bacterium]|nr:hypothetical protein [Afifellaceae bacterium]